VIYRPLSANPLKSYSDCTGALLDIVRPYEPLLSPGGARLECGPPGATFRNSAVGLEGFARLLWGLVPYVAGGNSYGLWDRLLAGLANGVNPAHEEYWGQPGDYDQLLVEMAVLAYALCSIPEKTWDPLPPKAKTDLLTWLGFINRRKIPDCNWIFFRILVNCALKKLESREFDERQLQRSLDLVDRCYLGGGWYNDGFPDARRARDYYVPWAFHYYGLILAGCCGELIPDRAPVYLERARAFAADFLYWFAPDGSALPYGRSLTYRYAAGAFWAALAFADCEALPWGEIKGLYLRHLRWWFQQPFFSESGLQSIGFRYPNLHMAERYNSPNSPLWALKAFIALAVPEQHGFWRATEEPLCKPETAHLQPHTGFLISDHEDTGHLFALSCGQWTPGEANEHNHMAEKYGKFAYSAYFGFNVATDTFGVDKLGHDNMLLVSRGDRFYRYRMQTLEHSVSPDRLSSAWEPFEGMRITTHLCLHGAWSIRLHYIESSFDFSSVEGGFALPYDDASYPLPAALEESTKGDAFWRTRFGFSGIRDIAQSRAGRVIVANPNANIMHERTFIPSLLGDYPAGAHWLGCAVLAHPEAARGERLWRQAADLAQIVEDLKSARRTDRRAKGREDKGG
jgi:hypothetical protein